MWSQMARAHTFSWVKILYIGTCGRTRALYVLYDGHVGSFHVFAMVINIAVREGVDISLQIVFLYFLDKHLVVEL